MTVPILRRSADNWIYIDAGDVAEIRTSPAGNEHLVIVDRIRDMIKVKVCMALVDPSFYLI